MKLFRYGLIIFIVTLATWWIVTAPPASIRIGSAMDLQPTVPEIIAVTSGDDIIRSSSSRTAKTLPGYDEVVLLEDKGLAYAMGIDGWIWKIDLVAGTAAQFIDTPLMPAGARLAPDDDSIVYFCASYLFGENYPEDEQVGLYQLDLQTEEITALVLMVPKVSGIGETPKVYPADTGPVLSAPEQMQAPQDGRPLAFCNDLDVSNDGQHIYFTEPFSYANASMGGAGTYKEAVSLGQNGLVWRYDFAGNSVSLVAQNFTFPDGILVETSVGGQDASLLVAETVKFQIQRFFLTGERAGQSEIVQENLPAMPDGLDRDAQGNIWIGMIKQRSNTIDKIHRNPWLKPLLLRLPYNLMPVSRESSYMALTPDASTPLFYSVHDGSTLTEISVVIPGYKRLFIATVGHESRGLYSVPYPEALKPVLQ